jgi:hypothetical protein
MKLSSASYPLLHVFGGGTEKLFEMRPVTPPPREQTVFGSLPQSGETACNRPLGLRRTNLIIIESHRVDSCEFDRLPRTIRADRRSQARTADHAAQRH